MQATETAAIFFVSFLFHHSKFQLTSPFSFLIRLLNSFPSRQIKSSPGCIMPHLAAIALAVLMLSPVTIRTVMPARWHLRMASGTFKGQQHFLLKHQWKVNKVYRSPEFCCTSGRTGSSIPTRLMHVNSVTISASFSQSGSGLGDRSRYAMQMVLSPSHAIGSMT